MNIASTPAVQAATAAATAQGGASDAVHASVQLRVLKKALDAQEAAAGHAAHARAPRGGLSPCCAARPRCR